MAKYRIVEITRYQNTPKEIKKYIIQTRLFGFLWWYDPFYDDMYSDGYFGSFEKALEEINNVIQYPGTEKVVWEK